MFKITNPSITLQCDTCSARNTYNGSSIVLCRMAARDDGWRLKVIPAKAPTEGRGNWLPEQKLCQCLSCKNQGRKLTPHY